MSEGKRVPGPFYGANTMDGKLTIHKRINGDAPWRVARCSRLSERDDLVDLLNKGTHYDGMMEALREIVAGCVEREDEPDVVLNMIEDRACEAIAKAAGE